MSDSRDDQPPVQPDSSGSVKPSSGSAHATEWYGDRHPIPPQGHADREHIFAKGPSVDEDEIKSVLGAWKSKITDPENGAAEPLGEHLRPSTPPQERFETALDEVQKDTKGPLSQVQVISLYQQHLKNMGFIPAMMEHYNGEDTISAQDANQLIKFIDCLELETARGITYQLAKRSELETQLEQMEARCDEEKHELRAAIARLKAEHSGEKIKCAKLEKKGGEVELEKKSAVLEKERGDYKSQLQRMMEYQSVPDSGSSEHHNQTKQENSGQPEGNAEGDDSRDHLAQGVAHKSLSDSGDVSKDFLPDLGDVSLSELSAANDALTGELDSLNVRLLETRQERDELKAFSNRVYDGLRRAQTNWGKFVKAVNADQQISLSRTSRFLVRQFYKDLEDMERKMLETWPGTEASRQSGKLHEDALIKAALDLSDRQVQDAVDKLKGQNKALHEQEAEKAERLRNLEVLNLGNGELKNLIKHYYDAMEQEIVHSWPRESDRLATMEGAAGDADEAAEPLSSPDEDRGQTGPPQPRPRVEPRLGPMIKPLETAVDSLNEAVLRVRDLEALVEQHSNGIVASQEGALLDQVQTLVQSGIADIESEPAANSRPTIGSIDNLLGQVGLWEPAEAPSAAAASSPLQLPPGATRQDAVNFLATLHFARVRGYVVGAVHARAGGLAAAMLVDLERWARAWAAGLGAAAGHALRGSLLLLRALVLLEFCGRGGDARDALVAGRAALRRVRGARAGVGQLATPYRRLLLPALEQRVADWLQRQSRGTCTCGEAETPCAVHAAVSREAARLMMVSPMEA